MRRAGTRAGLLPSPTQPRPPRRVAAQPVMNSGVGEGGALHSRAWHSRARPGSARGPSRPGPDGRKGQL
ncbi:putative hypothetical protein [Streptomyces sp. NBRC 110611]|nr:putative hypothetical protein [Streptomyces sp. NBRC 110611]